jgi:hypothetical protein
MEDCLLNPAPEIGQETLSQKLPHQKCARAPA